MTSNSDIERGFAATLDADPCDWATRLVYADWLEQEAGRPDEAACQRWMVRWWRAPMRTDTAQSASVWDFWAGRSGLMYFQSAELPEDLCALLESADGFACPARWGTRAEAEADLARVLAKVGYDAVDAMMREAAGAAKGHERQQLADSIEADVQRTRNYILHGDPPTPPPI